MDLLPILAHLKGQLSGLRKIGGAADLSAIGQGSVPAPALFLVPLAEAAGDTVFTGDTVQRVAARFSVVLAVTNKTDPQGEAALGSLEPLRDQVKAALLGWSPAPGFDPVAFVSGQLISFGEGVLWWGDEFETAYFMRSP